MAFVRVHPPLQVDELTIREYSMADVNQFHDSVLANREYLVPWLADWIKAEPLTLEKRHEIFQEWVDTYPTQSNPLGIFIGDTFVGSTGLADENNPGEVEIRYWVDEKHQGKAIASRVAAALSDWALTQPGIDCVVLLHKVGNDKSYRVAEKSGFTLTDTIAECGHTPALRWTKTK